jgi:basic amino acid/polyamine antiporter, APA family
MPGLNTSEKKLGLLSCTSLVIGNMIGSGIFLMPAALAAFGAISLWGWFFSTTGAILLAKVFSNVSSLLPLSDGGPYAFSKKGLGNFAGFLVGWGYWISVLATNAAITVSLVGGLSTFFPVLQTNNLLAIIVGLSSIWLFTWINTLGVAASGKMQIVTTLLKIIPLILVGFVGIFYIKLDNFTPFNASGTNNIAALTATTTYTFFAFLGVECATIPAGNVTDPKKTIPLATMLGTIITAIIYLTTSIAVMGLIPLKDLQHSVTPFADAGTLIWGDYCKYFISAGVVIAAFGALNGWILIQGQIPAAIANDKLLPAIFAKKNRKGVPVFSILLSSILVSLFMSMNFTKGLVDQFKFLILLATLTSLIPYLFTAASYIIIKSQQAIKSSTINWIASITLAAVTFLFLVWMVIGSGKETVYWGFVFLLIGLPFYVYIVWRNKL